MTKLQDIDELWRNVESAASLGDSRDVIFALEQLSNAGCVEVLSTIGTLYEAGGQNLDKDAEQAVKWFQRSLEFSDDPVAHVGLGRACYYNLGGVIQDYERASFHFNKAYQDGFPEAALYMGICAYEGLAIEKNILKAEEYFKQSASQGYCLAYLYLARLSVINKRFIKASYFVLTAYLKTWKIRRKDPSDRRLIGMLD